MPFKKLNPFKDFQSDQIQRSSRKIFTAYYACRNASLNLTPVTGTTNGFIFQIINSVIESWGVRLTYFDCNDRIAVLKSLPLPRLQEALPSRNIIYFVSVYLLEKSFSRNGETTRKVQI